MTIIRPASADDVPAIHHLLVTSFARPDEAGLVQQLAIDGDLVLVMVAVDGPHDEIVGVAAFSRMQVAVDDKTLPAVALAPIAVDPEWRRSGIAELLVKGGLDALKDADVALAFVLGEPGYYGRFGFAENHARGFDSPYAGPFFMAMALGTDFPTGARGVATHAPAFETLAEDA